MANAGKWEALAAWHNTRKSTIHSFPSRDSTHRASTLAWWLGPGQNVWQGKPLDEAAPSRTTLDHLFTQWGVVLLECSCLRVAVVVGVELSRGMVVKGMIWGGHVAGAGMCCLIVVGGGGSGIGRIGVEGGYSPLIFSLTQCLAKTEVR